MSEGKSSYIFTKNFNFRLRKNTVFPKQSTSDGKKKSRIFLQKFTISGKKMKTVFFQQNSRFLTKIPLILLKLKKNIPEKKIAILKNEFVTGLSNNFKEYKYDNFAYINVILLVFVVLCLSIFLLKLQIGSLTKNFNFCSFLFTKNFDFYLVFYIKIYFCSGTQ